jgi:hypothetical protein
MQRINPTQNTLPKKSYHGNSISQRSIYDNPFPPPFAARNETQVRQSWDQLVEPALFRPMKNTEIWTTAASRLTSRPFLNGAEAELRASDIEQQDTLGGADDLVVKGLEIMEDGDFLVDLETIFD